MSPLNRAILLAVLVVYPCLGGLMAQAANQQPASRVCRPGPPLRPPTDGRKNCLVIGDSVSLGYTPYVVTMLNKTCQVQHAPFSSDGGALDTKYAMQCFDQWMVTSLLEPTQYDAIVINSGLHDVNYSGSYPEEYTSPDEYRTNLQELKKRLLAYTPHVASVTTTPVGYNVPINDLVVKYNEIAVSVMHGESPTLNIIDLYSAVIKVCGVPPYKCSIEASPTSVHYNAKGYEMLASVVAQGFTQLLSQGRSHRGHETDENVHDHPNPAERSQREREEFGRQQARQPPRAHHLSAGTVCSGGNTACPVNTTCIKDSYSDTGFGCCYLRSMVDCKDNWHCCPQGMQCGSCSLHGCMCLSP